MSKMQWDRRGQARATTKQIKKTPVAKPDDTNYAYREPTKRSGNKKSRRKVTLPYVRG